MSKRKSKTAGTTKTTAEAAARLRAGTPRAAKPAEPRLTREEEEARVREQLRALGYL